MMKIENDDELKFALAIVGFFVFLVFLSDESVADFILSFFS